MASPLPALARKRSTDQPTHRGGHALHAARKKKKKKRKKKHHHHSHSPPPTPPNPQPPAQPPKPPPNPAPGPAPQPAPDLNRRRAERLLWRAGLDATVQALTHPSGAANLVGPEPTDEDGNALAPADAWGHDHLWLLDRMVRSDQQLVERMTLIWHDWFATSNDKVSDQQRMLDQNATLRANALGSFQDMLTALTPDPAMLVWLDGIENDKYDPNENYARELMELFTLGADRGAYTEQDVRELARALTGFRATWTDGVGLHDFRYDDSRHDHGTKTVFGKSGDFDWRDAIRLCLENPYHASFFVTKLWGYFIPTPPDGATQAALQRLYLDSGYGIAPVVEAILKHPDLYSDRALVKPPVVYNAGLLRATGQGIKTSAWAWLGSQAGQQLFYPPNVSRWDDSSWLDTSTWRARSNMVTHILRERYVE